MSANRRGVAQDAPPGDSCFRLKAWPRSATGTRNGRYVKLGVGHAGRRGRVSTRALCQTHGGARCGAACGEWLWGRESSAAGQVVAWADGGVVVSRYDRRAEREREQSSPAVLASIGQALSCTDSGAPQTPHSADETREHTSSLHDRAPVRGDGQK